MTTLVSVTNAIRDITASAGVVVGGVWAYYKFIRGRTFVYRAELRTSAKYVDLDVKGLLLVSVEMENTGSSKIPLTAQDSKNVQVYAASNLEPAVTIDWEDLDQIHQIFSSHQWIEAGETIVDEVALVVLRAPYRIYDVRAKVVTRKRRLARRGCRFEKKDIGVQWSASAIVQRKEV